MAGRLVCRSFHSVKGGVGKSTLATALALSLAKEHPSDRVVLIDLDLTGTSLADVLPLRAPYWHDDNVVRHDTLLRAPDGHRPLDQTAGLLRAREDALRERGEHIAPFLNDFLLFAGGDWDGQEDIHPHALQWRVDAPYDNLRVIPSSALPLDLERILPLIFDEQHSAFLEARLEHLLDALVPGDGETCRVVVDVPPTIPGLSRAVMSLCMRLGWPPGKKVSLSDDRETPARLDAADVSWRANIVVTTDLQDIRAATRWLFKLLPDEEHFVRVVINRHDRRDADAARDDIKQKLRPSLRAVVGDSSPPDAAADDTADWHPLLGTAVCVAHQLGYRFFDDGKLPGGNFDELLEDGDR